MQTLEQYQYLDRDAILKGVVDWLVKESPILKALPMMPVQGNSLKYNVSTVLPTASWLAVGDPIAESTGAYVQRTASIYTMIQNAYTDKSQIALNATQNPEAIDAALAAQAMAHEFEETFVLGQTSTLSDAKEFKGILRLIAELEGESVRDLDSVNNPQVIPEADDSGALEMVNMDTLIDAVKPGKPDLLLMSRRARRKLNYLSRASGNGVLVVDETKFGVKMTHYDGVPIYVSDFILDNFYNGSSGVLAIATHDPTKARTTNYDNTVILALQLGMDKLTGLHAGEMAHDREEVVEDFNAILNRYTWYVGLALFKKYSAAVLINCNPDD